jgi:subtilisin family serine protease
VLARVGLVLVLAAAASAQDADFVLLAKTQLVDGPAAFARLCRERDGAKRSALRKEIVARLKKLAGKEQEEILDALGNPAGAQRLWIVNAVVVRLTPAQVEAARELPQVKWIYPAGPVPRAGNEGTVAEVLKPARRAPFSAKGKKIAWNVEALGAPRAWRERKVTGEGVVVAMLDAGVNYRHEDLRGNIWINADEKPNNGKDDDGNGLVDDLYGFDFARWRAEVLPDRVHHGTFTSCVVAGDGTGGLVTGVAPRARLMPLKAMGGVYLSARAFQYALENGADVMSMSFSVPGLGHTRGLWRLMAEHATLAGLVLVSGAGNFPNEPVPVQIRIPEGIPCVICAGGVTRDGEIPGFVSKGPVTWEDVELYRDFPMPDGLVKPDVCGFPGPGIGLVSPRGKGYLPENNRRHGNSLSAPHVAGACALVLAANPELPAWRVKEILERTARDVAPKGKDNETGAGLVDCAAAVEAALARK